MSKSFMAASDTSSVLSSPNLKIALKKYANQSEWAELIKHQAKIAKELINQEKMMKKMKQEAVRNALDSMVKQQESNKKLELENRQKESTQIEMLRAQYEREDNVRKNENFNMNKSLANVNRGISESSTNLAKQKREEERKIEENILKSAKLSLENEKIRKREKISEFQKGVHEILAMKEDAKKREKLNKEREKAEYKMMIEEQALYQSLKEAQYKQFYQMHDENQKVLQKTHSEAVLKKRQEKDVHIQEFIDKNIEVHNKKAVEEESQRKHKKAEDLKKMLEMNKSIIQENEKKKELESSEYKVKVQQTLREINDMNDYFHQKRLEKKKQQEQYRETLLRQSAEKVTSLMNSSKMTNHELKMNNLDYFRNEEIQHKSMVIGLTDNKPHRAQHSPSLSYQFASPGKTNTNNNNIEQAESRFRTPQSLSKNLQNHPEWLRRSPDVSPLKSMIKTNSVIMNDVEIKEYQSELLNLNKSQQIEVDTRNMQTPKLCKTETCSEAISPLIIANGETQPKISNDKPTPVIDIANICTPSKQGNRSVSREPYKISNLDYLFSSTNDKFAVNNTSGIERSKKEISTPIEKKLKTLSRDSSAVRLANSTGAYNPITNPLPFTIQNPYLIKEIERGEYKIKPSIIPVRNEYSPMKY